VFPLLLAIIPSLSPVATALGQGAGALPQPVGYVNDFANVLSPEAKARMADVAQRVHDATKGDLVVVTLPDLGGRPVEEVSLRLGREWKVGADAAIGDQARNAGVVILLVPKETSSDGRGYCRIEVGQGAEGFITDATAGTLCREQTDYFRAQDYASALEALTLRVADLYASNFGVTLDGVPRPPPQRRTRREGLPFPVLVALVVLFFVLNGMGRRRRGCVGCIPIPVSTGHSSGHWGGGGGDWGGSSGGFGGFGGGGGFSGGGGGSSW
jgi:uncharacterized protein